MAEPAGAGASATEPAGSEGRATAESAARRARTVRGRGGPRCRSGREHFGLYRFQTRQKDGVRGTPSPLKGNWELLPAGFVCLLRDPTRASERLVVVTREEVVHADAAGLGAGRMDELSVSYVHPDVRDSPARRVEEDQVARLHAVMRNRVAGVVLLCRCARELHALAPVDVLG